MNWEQRCRNIQVILSDVDGVLTDGGIIFDNQGIETKKFHIRDGGGIKLWQKAGFRFGIITGRTSQIVKVRAAELALDVVRQGHLDKLTAMLEVLAEWDLELEQACYIGDDLFDLKAVRHAGLGVAVADAAEEVRQAADLVTQLPGGHGAVRELVETVLKAQGRWEEVIRKYL